MELSLPVSKLIGRLQGLTVVWLLDVLQLGCCVKATILQLAQQDPIRQLVFLIKMPCTFYVTPLMAIQCVFQELTVILCFLSLSPSYSLPALDL